MAPAQRGGNLLCLPDVIERLLAVISSGNRDQFEIDSDDRNLKLGATAFGDILSLTVSDVTALKKREASFRLLFDNNPMPMWVFDTETTEFPQRQRCGGAALWLQPRQRFCA